MHYLDNVGYFGMKGLIDLRVADILAKQAIMQNKAALFQSKISQHESDHAHFYTAKAEAIEKAVKEGTYDPEDPDHGRPLVFNPPNSAVRYSPWELSVLSKGRAAANAIKPAVPAILTMDSCSLTPITASIFLQRRLSAFI
jgi:hypothetical protein